MTGNIKNIDTNQIIEHLTDLSSKTEKIFLNLGYSLPALFREIEGGKNKANHLIQVFSKDSIPCKYSEQDNLLVNSIDKAETLVGDATDFFIALENRDCKLFDAINSNIDCMDSLENQFLDIREDSIDMESALQLIRTISTDIESSITLYTKGNSDDSSAINDITIRIKDCYEQLSRSSETLSNTLQTFTVYSDSFFTLLDSSELEIIELNELIVLIDDIRSTLAGSVQAIKIRENEILSEIGIEKWILKSSKLGEIINQFTIYTHKQTAKNIAGIEFVSNEEVSKAGELTLF